MFKALFFSLIPALLSLQVMAAAPAGNATLQKVSKKYRAAKLVEMNVEKVVTSDMLGERPKQYGKIFLADGKFRWENTKPEKSLLVFDGKTIWSEQTPPADFGGPVQVARGKVDKKTRSHLLISSLMGGDLQKSFKILKEEKIGDILKLEIKPIQEGDLTVTDLKISVNVKSHVMDEISYKDDIGNVTTLVLTDVKFKKSENGKLFKYQKPDGAELTEL